MASASFGDNNSGFQAGTINGPVNTEFHQHAPPERLETPPNPSAVIPFSRDTDFVERGTILDQIHQKCAVLGSRTALVGLGGVGKSQLAIEYAYRIRHQSPGKWVFWVHASNAARFEESFRDIANYVKAPGRQNQNANIYQIMYDWLRDDRKGEWVLILDNLDDDSFLVDGRSLGQDVQMSNLEGRDSRPLISYLPQCQNGTILITTRTKEAVSKLVEERNMIAVDPMELSHAVALLQKKLDIEDDNNDNGNDSDIAELAEALEYMPLAIVQAAAYISQRAPRCSVRQYLDDFRRNDREKISLLNYQAGYLRRDQEAKNSIIITWHISFEHINRSRRSAADLLSLMSLFDRQGIPERLVRNRAEIKSPNRPKQEARQKVLSGGLKNLKRLFHRCNDRPEHEEQNVTSSEHIDQFEDDLLTLRNYAFISGFEAQSTFKMHALVQLAMITWLEANGQLEKWRRHYCKILCAEFPTGEYENWAKCQELFPHAQSILAQQPEDHKSLKDWSRILYRAAWYALRIGNTGDAEKLAQSSLQVSRRIFGPESRFTINVMILLVNAHQAGGQWKEAELLGLQVMEMAKQKFGIAHLDTMRSMSSLASTYGNQGRWDIAEELEMQLMETYKKKLGVDHRDTLTSMGNLASTYWKQGRWDIAEELEMQVMETRKKKLGVDHPDTLNSMSSLAFTWKEMNRTSDAVRLMEECVQLRKKVLALDHPHTLSSCRALVAWKAEQEDLISAV